MIEATSSCRNRVNGHREYVESPHNYDIYIIAPTPFSRVELKFFYVFQQSKSSFKLKFQRNMNLT